MSIKKYFKQIDGKLFLAIALTLLIPSIYNTFRIHLIGNIPNEWGFNITSQVAWLNIIYEILQEGITLPLYFILGSVVYQPSLLSSRFNAIIILIIPVYAVTAFLVWFFADGIVSLLNQKPNLISETISYIRLETIAIPLRVIVDICIIVIVLLSDKIKLYFFILGQLIIRICSDYLFISENALNLGIMGVAYSSIAIYVISAFFGLMLIAKKVFIRRNVSETNNNKNWLYQWFRISVLSGIESGVRNIAFIAMILKLMNEIEKSGVYWTTNTFIWGWLLLPVLALGSLIKKDVGNSHGIISQRLMGYFILTSVIVVIWLLTTPFWGLFIHSFMGIDNYDEVLSLTFILLFFYITFAFNNVFDSYLYGMGRTDLMLYQSLIVNLGYYAIAYVLYKINIFVPTLYSMALLFGFGIVVDFLATVVIFRIAKYPVQK